jgi:type II secretory pathway component PulF
MNSLASRKKLLVAESELNRAQLLQDWQTMADDIHALADQARTVRSLASAAASLLTGLMSLRRKKTAPVTEKKSKSIWQVILQGAQMAGSFLSQGSSQNRD